MNFRELRANVASISEPTFSRSQKKRIPTMKDIDNQLKSGIVSILYESHRIPGIQSVLVYSNGFFSVTDDDGYSTVYAVDRVRITFEFTSSTDERNKSARVLGLPPTFSNDGKMIVTIPETEYEEVDWDVALWMNASEALINNATGRYHKHTGVNLEYGDRSERAAELIREAMLVIEEKKERDEKYARLHKAMEKLTDKQKTVVDMYFYKNMTQEEIAQVMHTSQNMVSKHIKAACNRLEKNF